MEGGQGLGMGMGTENLAMGSKPIFWGSGPVPGAPCPCPGPGSVQCERAIMANSVENSIQHPWPLSKLSDFCLMRYMDIWKILLYNTFTLPTTGTGR